MNPTVSVMIPAFNSERFVETTISSVLRQSFTDFEIVIIDDGSTDRTCELIEQIAAKDSRVRLKTRPNAGIVPTRNELLDMARGEFVAVLDHDDLATPRRLEVEVDFLRNNPEYVVVGGDMEIIDPDGDSLCVWELPRTHEEIDSAIIGEGRPMVICHSSVLMRRKDVLRAGGYRAEFNQTGAEDLDLWLRMTEIGRIRNLPEVLVKFRVHASSFSHRLVAIQKHYGALTKREARVRRGLIPPAQATGEGDLMTATLPSPPPADEKTARAHGETLRSQHERWGWWALNAGNVATARKHARATVRHAPLSSTAWRLMACAIRGH